MMIFEDDDAANMGAGRGHLKGSNGRAERDQGGRSVKSNGDDGGGAGASHVNCGGGVGKRTDDGGGAGVTARGRAMR